MLLGIFRNEILKYKRDTRDSFEGSDLALVFLEILGEL